MVLAWHKNNNRNHLPWRHFTGNAKTDAYRVWLSEILLQQTQANRVVDFYNRIVDRFPTVAALSKADFDTFFPYYK